MMDKIYKYDREIDLCKTVKKQKNDGNAWGERSAVWA
jgi:hypothetical protein